MNIKAIDRIGERHGRLVITGIAYVGKRSHSMAHVECDCGKSAIIEIGCMTRKMNKTSSCGCLKDEVNLEKAKLMQKRIADNPNNSLRSIITRALYKTCQRSALVMGRAFELSFEQWLKVVDSACFYCGEMDVKKVRSIPNRPTNTILLNGIDRIDNSVGYTVENSVPCCKICNMMKGKLTVTEFIQKCKKISVSPPSASRLSPRGMAGVEGQI